MNGDKKTYDEIINHENLKDIFGNAFIYNDYDNGRQVLKSLLDNLYSCDEFCFSVAFISYSGLAKLKLVLNELKDRNIKGKIITTNYLFFSDPKALRELMAIGNVDLRMYYLEDSKAPGFHTKGYIFKTQENYKIIIGSSNLTQEALTVNKEWNTEISGKNNAIAIKNIVDEFQNMWDKSVPIGDIIGKYEEQYRKYKKDRLSVEQTGNGSLYRYVESINPNTMQLLFMERLEQLIKQDQKRALLISATGTGKTYASAFAYKNIVDHAEKYTHSYKKMLFVTHRNIILQQAKSSFDKIFGKKLDSTLFAGGETDYKKSEAVFASHGLLIRDEHLHKFRPDEFDFIIIDEVHRVGDNKYQKIIDYFKPKFLLGMSATPDRTDGYDVYGLFDHNIAYEIRLMGALESQMLTPFNYFGITDLNIDNQEIKDLSDFNLLTSEKRVEHIIRQIEYYGYSGPRAKGLVFVSGIEEGKELSSRFNDKGFKTVFLDGSSSNDERENAIEKLESNDAEDFLDYIFTVDVFNEGVDIPSVNQVILLRPTKSSIIFIQQIGRGLRLHNEKEFVTILDFIGNYTNNYLITQSFAKGKLSSENIIKPVFDLLPGASSVQFDEISRERIYNSVDNARINGIKAIFDDYAEVKNRLGKIPTLSEFQQHGTQPVRVFLDLGVFDSYYDFLVEKEKDYRERLTDAEAMTVRYISKYFADGKRNIEIAALKSLIEKGYIGFGSAGFKDHNMMKSVIALFDTSFNVNQKFRNTNLSLIEKQSGKYVMSAHLRRCMGNSAFRKHIDELIECAGYLNKTQYQNANDFVLFEKYTRLDVCRLINNPKDEKGTIFGYKHFKELNVLPVFVSYHKNINDTSTNYEDEFLSENRFVWFSRHSRTSGSGEIKEILDSCKKDQLRILLFVQKSNSKHVKDDGSFYYLGECKVLTYRDTTKIVDGVGKDIVRFVLELKKPCRKDVYDYLISPL